jgi:hypothetical protein
VRFTQHCGQSRAGKFLLKRKSRRDRQAAKLGEIRDALRRRTHSPLAEQRVWVRVSILGYFAYHAVPWICIGLHIQPPFAAPPVRMGIGQILTCAFSRSCQQVSLLEGAVL